MVGATRTESLTLTLRRSPSSETIGDISCRRRRRRKQVCRVHVCGGCDKLPVCLNCVCIERDPTSMQGVPMLPTTAGNFVSDTAMTRTDFGEVVS